MTASPFLNSGLGSRTVKGTVARPTISRWRDQRGKDKGKVCSNHVCWTRCAWLQLFCVQLQFQVQHKTNIYSCYWQVTQVFCFYIVASCLILSLCNRTYSSPICPSGFNSGLFYQCFYLNCFTVFSLSAHPSQSNRVRNSASEVFIAHDCGWLIWSHSSVSLCFFFFSLSVIYSP
jgi:hypothetical protein